MHAHQIVHRDFKAENILVGGDGHIKLTDFGFSRKIQDKTYTMCGTPEHMAPEIIMGLGYDHRVDWWALGIFMFEILAGNPPFYDDNI